MFRSLVSNRLEELKMPSSTAAARKWGPEHAGAEWERDVWYPLKKDGCYVQLTQAGALCSCPMLKDGARASDDEMNEVEEPGNPLFLELINTKFKTDFQMEDFGFYWVALQDLPGEFVRGGDGGVYRRPGLGQPATLYCKLKNVNASLARELDAALVKRVRDKS